jgi:hypothetical protein
VSQVELGTVVWAVIAAVVVAWLAVTQLAGAGRLPGAVDVVRWFLRCWLGRLFLVAAWAGAGWHVFCQRP